MIILVASLAGFLAGRLLWLMLRPALQHSTFERINYRERIVPTAGGLVVPLAVAVIEAGRVLLGAAGVGDAGVAPARLAVLTAAMAFGLLGVVDDLAAMGDARGFRGHFGSLLAGELTTGGAKLMVGGAAALVLASWLHPAGSLLGIVRDGLLIALAANTANLFDRAPGRMLKVTTAAFVALVAAAGATTLLAPVGVAVGAALALALDDLHERVMLGDAGANVLGAVLGLGAVAALGPVARTAVVVTLLLCNAASEIVSFSRVIDGFPPLRALDRAGRRP